MCSGSAISPGSARTLKRQLTNPSAAPTVVLALGGDGEHQSRDGVAWVDWDDESDGRPPPEIPLPDDLPA